MKKVKYLVLSTALATMLMGAGYAAWTDQITLNNTVDTGELKVVLSGASESYDANFKSDKEGQDNPYRDLQDNVLLNDEDKALGFSNLKGLTDIKNNTVSFEFTELYPGAVANTNFTAVNEGTLPAVIKDVEVIGLDGEEGDDLYNAMKVDYNFAIFEEGDYSKKRFEADVENVSLENLGRSLTNQLKGQYLLKDDVLSFGDEEINGDSMSQHMFFKIPANSLSGNDGENETITFQIKFNFVQHNMYKGDMPVAEPQ